MRWIALGALLACAALASPAGAATFCVSDSACVTAGGTSEPDLQTALNAAVAAAGDDTVRVGPGTYSAASGFTAGDGRYAVSLIGAGRDQTTLTATNAGSTVLDFNVGLGPGHDATVSDLTIAMPPSGGVGVNVPQHIARVTIAGGSGVATALWTQNTDVSDVAIDLPLDGRSANEGLYRPNGTLTADGLSIRAHTALDGNGWDDAYRHLRIVSDGTGIDLGGSGANMTIDDAQIRMSGSGTALAWSAIFGTPSSLTARFLTLQGDGTAGSVGVATSASSSAGSVARLDLEDSIVTGFAHALTCSVASSASASLTVSWSDFDPALVQDGCGGGVVASTGNLSADPQLQAASNGDLLLAAGSPAVDAGDPALTAPDPATDLAGNARLVDGNGDGVARVDMGAFEHAAPVPVVTPPPGGGSSGGGGGGGSTGRSPPPTQLLVSNFALVPARFAPLQRGRHSAASRRGRRPPHRGGTFRFRLSRAAAVTIRIELLRARGRRPLLRRTLSATFRTAGRHTLRFDGRDARGRALPAGRYRATIVARATGALASTPRSLRFTLLAG